MIILSLLTHSDVYWCVVAAELESLQADTARALAATQSSFDTAHIVEEERFKTNVRALQLFHLFGVVRLWCCCCVRRMCVCP